MGSVEEAFAPTKEMHHGYGTNPPPALHGVTVKSRLIRTIRETDQQHAQQPSCVSVVQLLLPFPQAAA